MVTMYLFFQFIPDTPSIVVAAELLLQHIIFIATASVVL